MTEDSRKADSAGASRRAPPPGLPANPSLSYNPIPSGELEETSSPTRALPRADDGGPGATMPHPAPEGDPAPFDAGFTLLRLIGRGGMGEVWEGIQRRLWRRVAIKRLRRGEGSTAAGIPQAMTREFHGEALTSALLDHPNIVPVYDLGFDVDGTPLLAMKMVHGQSWDRLLRVDFDALGAELHLARHLPILSLVAQAVAFAHSKGVVHRDLKPSQVMVGEFGEVLLMDWGLAIMVGSPPEFVGEETPRALYPCTDSAMNPAGTPGYMAPEQTSHDAREIGPWTDSYLLGGLLYHLLTGQRPHPGDNSDQAFLAAAEGIVTPIDEAAPGRHIPPELAALAASCLDRAPAARPTAAAFVEGIHDYLSGASRQRESIQLTNQLAQERIEPTYAAFVHALTRLGQAQRLWPENPSAAPIRERIVEDYTVLALKLGDLTLARAQAERIADPAVRSRRLGEVDAAIGRSIAQRRRVRQLSAAAYLLLGTIIVGGYFFTASLKAANRETTFRLEETAAARKAESVAKSAAEQESERAQLLLADSLVAQGRLEEAITELLRVPEERRFWEWAFVLTRATRDLVTIPFEFHEWSPDKSVALGSNREDGLCVLRAESGEVLMKLARSAPASLVWRFSRDGRHLAWTGAGKPISVIDTVGLREVASVDAPTTGTIRVIELSPDCSRIAVGDDAGNVRICDLQGGRELAIGAHGRNIRALYWGDRRLVSVSTDMTRRSDPDTGESEILRQTSAIEGLFHFFDVGSDQSRRYFAFTHFRHGAFHAKVDEGGLRHVDMESRTINFLNSVPWLFITSGSALPNYRIINVETGDIVEGDHRLDEDLVSAPAVSSLAAPYVSLALPSKDEGEALVSIDDWTFKKYTLNPLRPTNLNYEEFPHDTKRLVPTPDLSAVWLVDANGITHLRPFAAEFVGTPIPGTTASFGQRDKYTAQIAEYWLEQRDTSTGEIVFIGGRMFNLFLGGRLTSDGRTIYLPGRRGDEFLIEKSDRETNALLATYRLPGISVGGVALHADTARLVAIDESASRIASFDLSGTETAPGPSFESEQAGTILDAEYSPDGRHLLVPVEGGRILILDSQTMRETGEVEAHRGPINSLSYSANTQQWVTVGADRTVKFWTGTDFSPVASLGFDFDVQGVTISRNGRWLLAWPERGPAILKDIARGEVVSSLERTDFPMTRVRFIADDTRIVANSGGAARFWDPLTGRETFNIDRGFGEISNDSRMFIYYASAFDGTLMEIAPTRARVASDGHKHEFREELEEWKIRRHRKWSIARLRSRMPPRIAELATLEGSVRSPSNAAAALLLLRLTDGIEVPARGPKPLVEEAWARFVMTNDKPDARSGSVDGLDEIRALSKRLPECSPLLRAGLFATCLTRLRDAEAQESLPDPANLVVRSRWLVALSLHEEAEGRRESAAMLARRASAVRLAGGIHQGEAGVLLSQLGVEPPPPPPADIIMEPSTGLSPRVLRRFAARAAASPSQSEVWRIHADVWKDAMAEIRAYLDEVAPLPDLESQLERIRQSPAWQPYPEGYTMKQLVAELREKYERRTYGGRTLEEAIADEGRRIDALYAYRRKPQVGAP